MPKEYSTTSENFVYPSISPKRSEAIELSRNKTTSQMKRNLKASPNITMLVLRSGPKVFVSCSMRRNRSHMMTIMTIKK